MSFLLQLCQPECFFPVQHVGKCDSAYLNLQPQDQSGALQVTDRPSLID